jgi:NADP-dependent aldehyde dehydrogenase
MYKYEIDGFSFIGFERSNDADAAFAVINPRTNKELDGVFYKASSKEIDAAAKKAQRAFLQYREISNAERAAFLDCIADEIEAIGTTLVERVMAEAALLEGRVIGERGRTCNQLRMFARLVREGSWVEASVDHGDANRQPMPKPDLRKMLHPLGPVVVFGASNFPLAYSVAGGDTASALAAGNPVIVKGHPLHAGTSELVAKAILNAAKKCKMPDGVFSLIQDNGITTGQELTSHPLVQAVGFTGSLKAGRALFDLANKRKIPIPVFAEMGSTNPVVLTAGALKARGEKLVGMYAGSITNGVGQFCTAPGLFFAEKGSDLNRFKKDLIAALQAITADSMLNSGICQHYEHSVDAVKTVGEVKISEIKQANSGTENLGNAVIAEVSATNFLKFPNLRHEVFGPFALIIECETKAELNAALASLDGQLTGTIMIEDSELADYAEAMSLLKDRVGRLIYNGVPTGVEVNTSMQHGGPYPASTDGRFTSVGDSAMKRFARPIAYQDWPDALLPAQLQEANPLGIWRTVDTKWTT